MPYETYLLTREWRTTRDRAIRNAGFQCSRCSTKRDIQVHHRTYVNLGCEPDSDLEVLCRGCHLGHHVVRAQDQIALYQKLVYEALEAKPATVADLVDAVKVRCAELRIPYRDGQVSAAIRSVDSRLPVAVPKKLAELVSEAENGQPIGQAEAAGILSRIFARCGGNPGLVKHMPAPGKSAEEQRQHEQRLQEQIAQQKGLDRRRPLRERLEAIFSTRPE